MPSKVVRDGKVAVLVSHGFGAGWYSWNPSIPECLYDPDLIAALESGGDIRAGEVATAKWPDGYWGGAGGLQVHWVPEGTRFRVTEYDGAEGLEIADDVAWEVA